MLPGRTARRVVTNALMVGLWAGLQGLALAQAPPGEAGQLKPAEDGAHKPGESGAPKPPQTGGPQPVEGRAKPPDESAPRKTEDTAAKVRLVSILGREITNRAGDGGRVIDVLIDLDGRSGAVVVEFGGFLGIGSRKVAVDWDLVRFQREGDRTTILVDISREQIRDTAEYKPGEPPSVLGAK